VSACTTRISSGTCSGVVRELAASQRAFSTDGLWSRLDALPKPPEPRALRAVMTTARAQGFVTKSPFVVISQRPESTPATYCR